MPARHSIEKPSQVATNIVTTYAARGMSAVSLFVLFPLVAGGVGPEAFGVYLLATSIALLLQTDLGMGSATVKFVTEAVTENDFARLRRHTASSHVLFIIFGFAGGVVYALLFAVGWRAFNVPGWLAEEARWIVGLSALQILIGFASATHRHVLTALGRMDLANYVAVGYSLLRVAATTVVIVSGGGIVEVALIDTAVLILSGCSLWGIRRKYAPATNTAISQGSWSSVREMLRLNLNLAVLTIAAIVIMQSGNVILSMTASVAAVTIYSAGVRVYQLSKEVTNSLTGAFLPLATSQAAGGGHEANRVLYFVGSKYANALLVAAALPLGLFTEPLMSIWVGADLAAQGALVAQLLLLSLVVSTNHLIALPILTARGQLGTFSLLHCIWAASTVIAGFVLTPHLGVAGMALSVAVPVVILEPFYVGSALRILQGTPRLYLRDVILRVYPPAGVVLLIYLVATAPNAWHPSTPTETIAASLALSVSYAVIFWTVGPSRREKRMLWAGLLKARS
jgi:O-antigen/teichoic acid export membrane protein